MSRNRHRPAAQEPEKKAESQDITETKAHEKAQENAVRLEKAIASLIDQAETEMLRRGTQIEDKSALVQQIPQRKPNPLPVIYPVMAYGYDAPGGGLKKLMDAVRTIEKDIVKGMRVPDDQKNSPDGAAAFRKLFADFEYEMKNIQNGWMMGQPVEPEVLKIKVIGLEKKLADYEAPDDKKSADANPLGVDQIKLKLLKDRLADFPAKIDMEIDRLRGKAQERVYSNASLLINQSILDQEQKRGRIADLLSPAAANAPLPPNDWKKTLPFAFGDPDGEEKKRLDDEKECTQLCNNDAAKGADMAREKALERLAQLKNQEMVYDSGGEKFNVHRKKNEKGVMIFSLQYQEERDWLGRKKTDPKAMAVMVDIVHKQDPLSAIELDCPELDGSTPRMAKQCAKRIEKQLIQAVDTAEKARDKGIHIGLVLSTNAINALNYIGNKDLERKVKALYANWEKEVVQKQEEKEAAAAMTYSVGKEGGLGALLAKGFDDAKAAVGEDAALTESFKAKGDTPVDAAQRLTELKNETQKLDMRVKHLYQTSQSIEDKLIELENELKKPEVQNSSSTLADMGTQLEGLKAAQEAVNLKLAEIGGTEEVKALDNKHGAPPRGGVAANYLQWINSAGMQARVGIHGNSPDYQNLATQLQAAGDKATAQHAANQGTNRKMTDLKSQIETYQTAAEQKALADAKAAADPAATRAVGGGAQVI